VSHLRCPGPRLRTSPPLGVDRVHGADVQPGRVGREPRVPAEALVRGRAHAL